MGEPAAKFIGHPCVACGGTLRYARKKTPCVACRIRRRRQWYRDDPSKNQRTNKLRERRLREAAASRPRPALCEMCCDQPTEKKALCWDHDHQTGLFRGWLCINCNTGLGLLGDHIHTAMARLAQYAAVASTTIPETP